jgi:hypothetical protein
LKLERFEETATEALLDIRRRVVYGIFSDEFYALATHPDTLKLSHYKTAFALSPFRL